MKINLRHLGKDSWFLIKETFNAFMNDRGVKLSAALSYYTIFSLAPLLIIIISLSGFFFGAEAVNGEIFGQINSLVGNTAAQQIQEMIKNVKLSASTSFATTLGIVMLLVGASGVFTEIQDSLNFIWGLKAKPKRGLSKFLKNRLMSFSMIGSMGFLLLVGLIINVVLDVFSAKLIRFFPSITIQLFNAFTVVIVFSIITLLFAIIFKSLPDGKIASKDALIGASFSAVLFMIGKFAIGLYLSNSGIATIYGAAGSVILILLWVYYSSIILYFGAEFTKVYANAHGKKIIPSEYAVFIEKRDAILNPLQKPIHEL